MTQFLQIAATLMSFVTMCLLFVGIIPSLWQSKALYFLSGESAFATAVAYGALAVLGVNLAAPFGMVMWFLIGSVLFARPVWLTSSS
jgi:hypothetical protein